MPYELPEEGTYQGEIKHWFRGQSPNGTPFFQLNVLIQSKENEETGSFESVMEPFTVPVPFYMSSKALERTVQNLKYLGFTSKNPAHLDRNAKGAHDFQGQILFLRCEHEEYQGIERAKWQLDRRPRQADEITLKEMTEAIQEDFGREMDRAFGRVPETAGAGTDEGNPGY